jgi:hypothetical protein
MRKFILQFFDMSLNPYKFLKFAAYLNLNQKERINLAIWADFSARPSDTVLHGLLALHRARPACTRLGPQPHWPNEHGSPWASARLELPRCVHWRHDDGGADERRRGKLKVLIGACVVVDGEDNGLGELDGGWLSVTRGEGGGGAGASQWEQWRLGESYS